MKSTVTIAMKSGPVLTIFLLIALPYLPLTEELESSITESSRTEQLVEDISIRVKNLQMQRWQWGVDDSFQRKAEILEVEAINILDIVNGTYTTAYIYKHFVECPKLVLPFHAYLKFTNGSVYVPEIKMTFPFKDYIIWEGMLFVCMAEVVEEKMLDAQEVQSITLYDAVKEVDIIRYVSNNFSKCELLAGFDSFQMDADKSVYISIYNMVYEPLEYVIWRDVLLVCKQNLTKEEENEVGDKIYDIVAEDLNDEESTRKITVYHKASFCRKQIPYEEHKYKLLQNGSVVVGNRMYGAFDFVALKGRRIRLCYSGKVSYLLFLTYAGMSVSVVCLLLHFINFVVGTTLHSLSGWNLASLSIALFLEFSFLIFGQRISGPACYGISVIMYYSCLAAFFWMNIIAYDIFRLMRLATKDLRRPSAKFPRKRFAIYSTYCWGLPLIGAIIAVSADRIKGTQYYSSYLINSVCWFNKGRDYFIFFVGPMFCLICVNIILFALSATIIATKEKIKVNDKQRNALKRELLLYVKLAMIMGVTWVFALIAWVADFLEVANGTSLWYVFIILNWVQGFFIFTSFK